MDIIKSFIISLILLLLYLKEFKQTLVNNYGPYKLHWKIFETCKGVKRTDCGAVLIENKQNMSDLLFVLDYPKDCPIIKGRVTAGSLQSVNNTMKKLWNYHIDSPCQHFVLGPILKKAFKLSNNCKITKGHYEVHLNMEETCKIFLGPNFFYGEYVFKIMAYNNVNNFFCFKTEFDVVKL